MQPACSLALCAGVVLSACGAGETHLEVFASSEQGRAIPGVEISALPHDHVGLLDSLAAAAPAPRPTFDSLEAELAEYRLPDVESLHAEDTGWRATRDSVRQLADSLTAVGREAPGYARAYARLGELYRRFTQRTAEREARLREQIGPHRDLAAKAAAAADSMRQWERIAYADYQTLAESAYARSGRTDREAVTGADGIARLTLEPGPWWITARLRDPENPYLEYFWNIALVAGRFGPRRVPLPLATAERRWRH